jgi:ATP-binding cassette subfamily B protein
MHMGPHSALPRDRSAVRGAKVGRRSLRRAWTFARPYRAVIVLFLAAIVVDALIGLIPALAFRSILDTAIPNQDRRLITILAGLVVAEALADGGLTRG